MAVMGLLKDLAHRYVEMAISETSNSRPRIMRRKALMIGLTSTQSRASLSLFSAPSTMSLVWP